MHEFFVQYWIEFVCGGFMCLFSYYFKKALKKVQEHTSKQVIIHEGVIALLYDRLFNTCKHYVGRGYIYVDELRNVENLYTAYYALGGNGTVTEIFKRLKALPIRYHEKKEVNNENS